MENIFCAKKAIDAITSRGDHIKKVAEYAISGVPFESVEIARAVKIPARNVSRIIQNLEETYGFEFTRTKNGRFYQYQLINCTFNGKRTKKAEIKKRKSREPIIIPLRRPVEMNPLWARALQMHI